MTMGKGCFLDDDRFQNILCRHHKKANLDRLATPMVHDWDLGWRYEHSEAHHLIVS